MKGIWFFDDWLVERRDGLERIWGKPTFVKEVFTEFNPPGWMGYGGYMTAFYDQRLGRYVLYVETYPGFTGPGALHPGQEGPGAFEFRLQSDDPYNWPNPSYDPSATPAWKGFKDVLVDQHNVPVWAYAVKSLAGTPLAERGYVSTVCDSVNEHTVGGFSADGVHFEVDREHPWQDPGGDTAGDILWNQEAGLYEIFPRPVPGDRRIALYTTADFEQFSRPITILQPDALDGVGTEFYDMPPRAYEDMYVGLLHVYTTDRFEHERIEPLNHLENQLAYWSWMREKWPRVMFYGRVETELTYSYNGIHWYRSRREPFIGVRAYGLQGGGSVYGMEMLRTEDDKLLFFVWGEKGGHAVRVDMEGAGLDMTGFMSPLLYEMRLDGFCSLKTRGRDGVLRSKVVIPKAGEMSLNVCTTAHSAVLVQILDGDTAQPIPGYTWEEAVPISGDHLYAGVHWQERPDFSELIGRPVRIEIAMREAELFAIRTECEAFYALRPLQTLW